MTDQECIDAQRIVSETYDGGLVGPAEIQSARAHCENCEQCAHFVSTLAAIRRIPTPQPPATAVDSAILALREQKRIDDEAEAAQQSATANGAADPAAASSATPAGLGWPKWAVYASWGAAAAAALMVAGIVTVQGARYIVGGEPAIEEGEYRLVEDATAPSAAAPVDEDVAAGESTSSDARYVTVGEWVYEYTGPSTASRSTIATYGTTLTSLDTNDAPKTLDVYAFGQPDRVLVDDDGQLLEFALVTRGMRGSTYAMQSRPVTSYGQWPALPDGVAEPSQPNGSPELEPGPHDSRGVQTYTLAGADIDRGIAIPPDTEAADPAAGNPNWTWWAPTD